MKCHHCGGSGVEPDWAAFGEAARATRQRAGWSLRRLAWAAKVSPPYLSDLERGRRGWHGPKARAVLATLSALGGRAA